MPFSVFTGKDVLQATKFTSSSCPEVKGHPFRAIPLRHGRELKEALHLKGHTLRSFRPASAVSKKQRWIVAPLGARKRIVASCQWSLKGL